MDNLIGFAGVFASTCVGLLFAQADGALVGWENATAIAILGMTMYVLLTRVNERLDKLAEAVNSLRVDVKVIGADKDDGEQIEKLSETISSLRKEEGERLENLSKGIDSLQEKIKAIQADKEDEE